MRNIKIIIKKEFKQIFRTRTMLGIIFVMPIIQLLILAQAATYEMKDIRICVVDMDKSSTSRELINKFSASNYFKLTTYANSAKEAESALSHDKADVYINIENGFEKNLIRENKSNIMLVVNAIDGARAGVIINYASSVIFDYNSEFRDKYLSIISKEYINPELKSISIINQNWFNPELDYKTYMVPGLLVLLVSIAGLFLSGMNIVKEKEIGTIEQLNVTPIKKHELIIGKLIPFWLIGLFELGFGLIVAKIFYHTPIIGSLLDLYIFASVFMVLVLGIGFFISNIAATQQQSMFLTWFFTVIFILLSGLFTSIENMPSWAQTITMFNPLKYFIDAVRMILLKGAGLKEISGYIYILIIYAIIINSLAAIMYKKTV